MPGAFLVRGERVSTLPQLYEGLYAPTRPALVPIGA